VHSFKTYTMHMSKRGDATRQRVGSEENQRRDYFAGRLGGGCEEVNSLRARVKPDYVTQTNYVREVQDNLSVSKTTGERTREISIHGLNSTRKDERNPEKRRYYKRNQWQIQGLSPGDEKRERVEEEINKWGEQIGTEKENNIIRGRKNRQGGVRGPGSYWGGKS